MTDPVNIALARIPLGVRFREAEESAVNKIVGLCNAPQNALTMQEIYASAHKLAALRALKTSLEGEIRKANQDRQELTSATRN